MMETDEEVDQGQEISLLCPYLLLCLENPQAMTSKQFRLDLQHGSQHDYLPGASEFGIKGVEKHGGIFDIN